MSKENEKNVRKYPEMEVETQKKEQTSEKSSKENKQKKDQYDKKNNSIHLKNTDNFKSNFKSMLKKEVAKIEESIEAEHKISHNSFEALRNSIDNLDDRIDKRFFEFRGEVKEKRNLDRLLICILFVWVAVISFFTYFQQQDSDFFHEILGIQSNQLKELEDQLKDVSDATNNTLGLQGDADVIYKTYQRYFCPNCGKPLRYEADYLPVYESDPEYEEHKMKVVVCYRCPYLEDGCGFNTGNYVTYGDGGINHELTAIKHANMQFDDFFAKLNRMGD